MRPLLFTLLALVALSACTPADDAKAPNPKAASPPQAGDIATKYKHLRSMTPKPTFVDPSLAMLCRGASQREVEDARKASGPHAHTAITIYMNDDAARSFETSATPYPVGAIIVKEKEALPYWAANKGRESTKAHDGVGGMIKRAPGYDTDHGDWEYFYFENPAKIESGKISSCTQCHVGAAARDYVFGAWSKTP